MATEGTPDDVIITRPNRDPAVNKTTRVIVAILLVVSAALMLAVMIGGWDSLVGMQAVTFGFIIIYLGAAILVMRWNRGVLPVMAAVAIIIAIFAGVAAPEWFSRDKTGFIEPALSNTTLGLLTAIIIPVQVLLVAFALIGFRQAWNVEVERHIDPDEVEPLPTPPAGRPLPA